MLYVTKKRPARVETIRATWCKKDFMRMSPQFRSIRAKSRRPMDACGLCRHKFADGEMMGLAAFEKGGNKTLCQACADELLASAAEATKDDVPL